MIERILPPSVAVEEASGPLPGGHLFPEEEAAVAGAVDKRREEFTTGRECARRALAKLGVAPRAIGIGERREPRWPKGIVGSITHCAGYRAAAVARETDVVAIGIDAEPNQPLRADVLRRIADEDEAALVAELAAAAPDVSWDRLLFSAKESLYKAWFPMTGRELAFSDSSVAIDRAAFTARVQVGGERLAVPGRWTVQAGLVLTAVAVPPSTGHPSRT